MKCNCNDWKENINKIDDAFSFKSIHGCGDYDGKQFLFCPWCSQKLEAEKE